MSDMKDDGAIFRPSTLPPLTKTLTLYVPEGIEHTVRNLLDLQICSRFRGLDCTWWCEGDSRWITVLIEECSDTLKHIFIRDFRTGSGNLDPSSCYAVLTPT